MITVCAALLIFTVARADISIESRTLAPSNPDTKGVNLIFNQRIVTGGKIILSSRSVYPDGSVSFSQQEFTMDGTPIYTWQEGFWSNRWNHFETRYDNNCAEQQINDVTSKTDMPAANFQNPTLLWFWHTHPKVNESITVTYLAQNVIATSQIVYTYEGDEEMTLAGKKVNLHRVREDPLGAKGVYTVWWYDDQGMGVKRFHKTTQHEYTDLLFAWK